MNVHYADPKCQLCDEPTVGYINPSMNAAATLQPDRLVPRCKQHGGAMFSNMRMVSQDVLDALRAQNAAQAAALAVTMEALSKIEQLYPVHDEVSAGIRQFWCDGCEEVWDSPETEHHESWCRTGIAREARAAAVRSGDES